MTMLLALMSGEETFSKAGLVTFEGALVMMINARLRFITATMKQQ